MISFSFLPEFLKNPHKSQEERLYLSLMVPLFGLLLILSSLLLATEMVQPQKFSSVPELKKTLGFKDLLPTPVPYPINKQAFPLPKLTARSVVALDVGSMTTLYQKNVNLRVSPASTTKIMTALVALESYKLEDVLQVKEAEFEGNQIGLELGEELTVENLLYALLIGSANDAAQTLAENLPAGYQSFVEAMNTKAQELDLKDTRFANPSGLDDENHYSSAQDLARLTLIASRNPIFSKIVSTPSYEIADTTGTKIHTLKNTNELVGQLEGVKGVKTGWTENAGECLIALVERNGERVVTVILGSQKRFEETKALIEWIFANFSWQTIAPANQR